MVSLGSIASTRLFGARRVEMAEMGQHSVPQNQASLM